LSKDSFLCHLIVVQLFYEVAGKDGNANVTVVIGVTLMELIWHKSSKSDLEYLPC